MAVEHLLITEAFGIPTGFVRNFVEVHCISTDAELTITGVTTQLTGMDPRQTGEGMTCNFVML